MKSFVESTQSLGRALMLPIAVLPVAGLLLRLGQPDLLGLAPMAAAGDAIFSNLGMLFAIGVAVGLARENHGAAGLAGLVAFLVATKGAEVLIQVPPDVLLPVPEAQKGLAAAAYKARQLSKLSVPIGILSGIMAGALYNRYSDIRLPSYLAFFGGRRFVPIVAGCAGLGAAFVFGLGWPYVDHGMDALSHAVIESGSIGLFVYGVLNRILIVTGLHHILNNVAWFIVGDFHGVTGDLKRFFAGDPAAGMFMSGFFPVMMFGLPAACLAMYHTALPERRRAAGGLLLSIALTAFLTGVTEPVEFTFMFLAPALYALHAVLTGLAMVTMHLLGVKLGFGFSAGLFDYVLNFKLATHPIYLVPVGAVYFALYYGLFRYCIVRFNLKTPGREPEDIAPFAREISGATDEADGYIAALGGAANLATVDACTTRLRLTLADPAAVDEGSLRRLGSRGMVRVGTHGLQVVVGPIADQLAGAMRARIAAGGGAPTQVSAAPTARPTQAPASLASAPLPAANEVLAALGGAGNVRQLQAVSGRLLVKVKREESLDLAALGRLATRGVAKAGKGSVHLLHPDSWTLESELAAMLG